MDENLKKEMRLIFADGFTEVVVPYIDSIVENLATKDDVGQLENRLIRMEEKLDVMVRLVNIHDGHLSEHEKRIHSLESKSTAA
jgi:hypothetical protein